MFWTLLKQSFKKKSGTEAALALFLGKDWRTEDFFIKNTSFHEKEPYRILQGFVAFLNRRYYNFDAVWEEHGTFQIDNKLVFITGHNRKHTFSFSDKLECDKALQIIK